jgi:colanic acid/amylovoran biosynthesis glycosyltransferase
VIARGRRLVIVTSRFPFGSQESYLATELGELARYFERIAIVPVRTPAAPESHLMPPRVDVLPWPLVSAALLRRAVQALNAEPRRAFGAVSEVLRSRDRGRLKNLAVIVKALALAQWTMEHSFDHIHAYWLSSPATVAMLAATVSGVTWSSTAHRWDIYDRNAFDVKARSASFVRTISSRGTADVKSRMPALADRVFQLRLGTLVPASPAAVRARPYEFSIICPAALVPIKGHVDLFAALALLHGWGVPVRCTVSGTGPLRRELEARAARLHLSDAIEFTGFVPQRTLHAWYSAGRFSAVVLASRSAGDHTMEGVPSTLIEAMAFGVPVVATSSGSVCELVDEHCGRLAKPGEPADLARAIFEVYLAPDLAQRRAQRAYQLVAEQHDVRVQMRVLAAALSGERCVT